MRLVDLFENKKDFNSWFSGSKIINQDGSPRVMYHGANSRFKNFARDHNGLIFFTTEMDFAQGHIRNGGADSNIKSAYISSKNPWNFRNPRDIKNLINKLESDGILTPDTYDSFFDSDDPRDIDLEEIYEWFESGDWMIIESGRRVIPTIRSLGYDGIWMVEDGVLNLAVFSNNQIWPLSDEEQLSEATVAQLAPQYNLWTAPVKIKQPNYTGYIDVTVTAPDMRRARTLIKSMYGVQEWQIGSTKQVKPK
jgi:hypothetical protein